MAVQLPPPQQPPGAFGMPPSSTPPPPSMPPPPLISPPGGSPRTPRTPKMSPPPQGANSAPPPNSPPPPMPPGLMPATAATTAPFATAGYGMTGPGPTAGFGPGPTAGFGPGLQAPMAMVPYMAQPAQPQAMYAQQYATMPMYSQGMPQPGPGVFAQPGAGVQQGYWGGQPLQQSLPVSEKPVSSKNAFHFSYLEDLAYANGKALSCCDSIFHERSRALKVCIPTAALTVFFAVISIWMLTSTVTSGSDTTLRQCKVLVKKNIQVGQSQAARYRPTLHVHFVGEASEKVVTRFRDPTNYEVEFEEAQAYLSRFDIGSTVNCYEFDDGAVQLDDRDFVSIWGYVIVATLCSFSVLCYCVWMTSGFYACCSPNDGNTYQA